jgi:hypothetical protein
MTKVTGNLVSVQFSLGNLGNLVSVQFSLGNPVSLRPDDDGLTFHAINRGVVFADDADHHAFLESLVRTQLRYPFRLYEGEKGTFWF